MAEHLGGGATVKPLAWAIEPAPDSDIVVRARKVANDEGQEVEPGGDRVADPAGAAGNERRLLFEPHPAGVLGGGNHHALATGSNTSS